MTVLEQINNKLRSQREHIFRTFMVKRIGIFGSYVHGTQTGASDLDILVEFADSGATFDNYMELKFFLEDLFTAKVDLVIAGDIREELRDEILSDVAYV